jgi:hypothetical protein
VIRSDVLHSLVDRLLVLGLQVTAFGGGRSSLELGSDDDVGLSGGELEQVVHLLQRYTGSLGDDELKMRVWSARRSYEMQTRRLT